MCWQCDITQINQQALTDDVVKFMAFQLRSLPQSTQDILKLAACIGNQFDLKTLAIVSELSEVETAADLWNALQEGLILPQSEVYKFYQQESLVIDHVTFVDAQQSLTVSYKFLHDRVQQAAYSLIPEEQKQVTHLKIGQLLLNNTPITEKNENLFEIVNQLNIGKSLIIEPSQQIELAQLNLYAGQKARVATAYAAALEYSTIGIALLNQSLGQSCWQTHYDLTLPLYELGTEAAYLSGDFPEMQQWADIVLKQAKTAVDKMKVYAVKIQADMAQAKKLEAVKIGLEALELLGVSLPKSPESSDIQQALTQTVSNLQGKKIEDLINLPLMTDVEKLAVARMLARMGPPTYQAIPILFPLVICQLVNLSIQYGNSPFSSYGYACYGILLNAVFHDADSAYEFGKLASGISGKINFSEIKASVLLVVGTCTIHGKANVRETLPILLDGYQNGLESGNFEFAAYCAIHKCQHLYFLGQELTILAREMSSISDALVGLKQRNALAWNRVFQQSVLNLLHPSENPWEFQGEIYNEQISLPLLQEVNHRSELYYIYLNKLILCYLFGEDKQAEENALLAERYLDAVQGLLVVPAFYFYDSLAHLAIYPSGSHSQQEHFLNRVTNNQEKMKQWATDAPMNFQHKFDLVAAEQYRILGNKADAMDYYDRAITLAKEHGYIQEEALANELAAKFYIDWGKPRIAQEYMTNAYYGYARWGAKAKVADLERRYPQLLSSILGQTRSSLSTNETIFALGSVTSTSSPTSSSSSASVALDLATILKASQTISGEIELEKLLSALLSIVIENAGADKCVFIFLQSGSLLIQGLAKLSQSYVQNQAAKVDFYPMLLNPQPVEDSLDVPVGLINTVKRTLQPAVIVNATVHPQLINDPYIQQYQPKSILCSPILHQGKLLGVLYLENNLATGVFTSDRVELLNLLCTQAAISLENARLYQQQQNYAQQLERSLDELSGAQSHLQASQQRLQLLVQQTPLAVIEWDTNFQITDWNPAAERIFGYTKEEALGRQFQFIIPQRIQAEIDQVTTNILSQQGGNYSINENITKDGKTIICAWYNNPLVNADGELIGVASLADDITDRKVAEVKLQQKAEELENALQDLQQAQLKMVQSEKMSALGNLVAGVAHEMNNPLGFIAASLKQAQPTVTDIVEHLKMYQETLPNKSAEILEHAESIDLDYTLEDLPKMLDSISMACDRLKNISTSLRTFSRADQDYKVPFNIHQGIDSTILILKHRLKANEQRPAIEVITNYGNLPQVECFPGQLNQVFMNIIANAIDALEESNHGRNLAEIKANSQQITITTSVSDKAVRIAIVDNGKGMSAEIQQKIFDHLFTTKAVGKGTGLGLAIARQIVEETHGGKLSFNSVLGEGTEFIIEIPV